MLLKIFSIKDLKSGLTNIFTGLNEAVAMRDFGSAVNKPDGIYNKYPDDYELWVIGEFDTEKGIINTDCRKLVSALAYVKKETPANEQ